MLTLGSSYPFLGIFWSMLIFFAWLIWIWIAITVVADIFRSHDLSNWAKTLWILFIIVFPLIGVLGYLLIRGHKLHEHQAEDRSQYEAFRAFTQRGDGAAASVQASGGASGSHADDLQKLADLRDRGVLTDDEFERAKAKVLG